MKDNLGLLFAVILNLLAGWFWVWVIFQNGANVWKDSIIKWDKVLGKDTKENSFMLKPIIFKFFSTLFFLSALYALYLAFKSVE